MQLQLPSLRAANTIAGSALKLLVVLWALLAVAAVFVMTLGTDEAWVLNGLRSVLRPQVPDLSTEVVSTSGGAFALVNLGIEQLAGSKVWSHRLVSLLCLGLSFALVLKRRAGKETPASIDWLMLAPLIAIPGAIEVGTAALGTSVGLFLMLAAMHVWTAQSASLGVRVVSGGLLYGLAAASRFDLVLFGPAVLMASCLRVAPSGRLDVRLNPPAWAFVLIGGAVFLLNQWLMSLPADAISAEKFGASTGLGGWALNYPKLLNHWATLTTFAPFSLFALMAVSAFLLRFGRKIFLAKRPSLKQQPGSVRLTLGTKLAASAWILLTVGTALLMSRLENETMLPTRALDKYFVMMNLVTGVAILLSLFAAYAALKVWRLSDVRFISKLKFSLVGAACVFLTWFSVHWHLIGPAHRF